MSHPCIPRELLSRKLENYYLEKIFRQNPTLFYGFHVSSLYCFVGTESPIWHCLCNNFWPAAAIRYLVPDVRLIPLGSNFLLHLVSGNHSPTRRIPTGENSVTVSQTAASLHWLLSHAHTPSVWTCCSELSCHGNTTLSDYLIMI